MKKGKITILASVIAMLMVAGVVGAGTMAYFTDTETVENNVFTAGTIDLAFDTLAPVSFNFDNMAPGDEVSGSIIVANIGSLPGKLYGRTTYTKTGDGDNLANVLIVTSWQDPSMSDPSEPDISLKVLANQIGDKLSGIGGTWMPYGKLDSNQIGTFSMTIKFDPLAGNGYQGDGIVVKFEFLLVQLNHPII